VHTFARKHELPIFGVVPFDEAMPAAERAESAPLDHAPDAPAVRAIGQLAQEVVGNGRA
jgi:Flp pilus assembly CpaE family ATPase